MLKITNFLEKFLKQKTFFIWKAFCEFHWWSDEKKMIMGIINLKTYHYSLRAHQSFVQACTQQSRLLVSDQQSARKWRLLRRYMRHGDPELERICSLRCTSAWRVLELAQGWRLQKIKLKWELHNFSYSCHRVSLTGNRKKIKIKKFFLKTQFLIFLNYRCILKNEWLKFSDKLGLLNFFFWK